jgi:hypothetical protein
MACDGRTLLRRFVAFKRQDGEKRIAYGEVYVPHDVDSHGEFMSADDIERMAHDFIPVLIRRSDAGIDFMHDNRTSLAKAYPVVSFVNNDTVQSPLWAEGAWVLGTKFEDASEWERVKRGELAGYSLQALVYKVPRVMDVGGPMRPSSFR